MVRLGRGRGALGLLGWRRALAQARHTIRRRVRGGEERPSERRRRRDEIEPLPLLRGLRQFLHERYVRIILVAFGANLQERDDLVVPDPIAALLAHAGEARARARRDFAALQRETDLRAAGIAPHDFALSSAGAVHGGRTDEHARPPSGGPGYELPTD